MVDIFIILPCSIGLVHIFVPNPCIAGKCFQSIKVCSNCSGCLGTKGTNAFAKYSHTPTLAYRLIVGNVLKIFYAVQVIWKWDLAHTKSLNALFLYWKR